MTKQRQTVAYMDAQSTIPKLWAMTTLPLIFNETIGLAQVTRDFSNEVATLGETVVINTPIKAVAKRLKTGQSIEPTPAEYRSLEVTLNQFIYSSFSVTDVLESLSMFKVTEDFLVPCAESMAQRIDRLIFSKVHSFPAAGKVGTPLGFDTLTSLRTYATRNNWPRNQRFFNCTPEAVAPLFKVDGFTDASKIAGGGTALRDASLGKLLTFDVVDTNNAPHIEASQVEYATDDTLTANAKKGDTVVALTTAALTAGQIISIDGMVAEVVSVATKNVTLLSPLTADVASGAIVKIPKATPLVSAGAVVKNTKNGKFYDGEYKFSGLAKAPAVGQAVNFVNGTDVNRNAVEDTAHVEITPADVVDLSATKMHLGTHGDYNFAIGQGAIAFVSRPLVQPNVNFVDSSVVNFKGLGLRVTSSYDTKLEGGSTMIKFDFLAGVKIIEPSRAVRVLS